MRGRAMFTRVCARKNTRPAEIALLARPSFRRSRVATTTTPENAAAREYRRFCQQPAGFQKIGVSVLPASKRMPIIFRSRQCRRPPSCRPTMQEKPLMMAVYEAVTARFYDFDKRCRARRARERKPDDDAGRAFSARNATRACLLTATDDSRHATASGRHATAFSAKQPLPHDFISLRYALLPRPSPRAASQPKDAPMMIYRQMVQASFVVLSPQCFFIDRDDTMPALMPKSHTSARPLLPKRHGFWRCLSVATPIHKE